MPHDFMHLVWENLIPNLLKLWTGTFKGMDTGSEDYQLPRTVQEAVSSAAAASGSTIPAVFSCRVPNFLTARYSFSAEAWSFWGLYLGPILLRGRFRREKFYKHFVKLVRLLHVCLQWSISKLEIEQVRTGFAEWVVEYERIYYQHNLARLPLCLSTIHALLHIADDIEAMGPVWCYWAFPMERFCGSLLPAIKSRRYPFASVDARVRDLAALGMIKMIYQPKGLHLNRHLLDPDRQRQFSRRLINYSSIEFRAPRTMLTLTAHLKMKIIAGLATRYRTSTTIVRRFVPLQLEQWGRVQILNGGDLLRSAKMIEVGANGRDATFVRYELLVDRLAHRPHQPPCFAPELFYGRLEHIVIVEIAGFSDMNVGPAETLALAAISQCEIDRQATASANLVGIAYYDSIGPMEVVDLATVDCLAGRVDCDRNRRALIDRSGARADFVDDTLVDDS